MIKYFRISFIKQCSAVQILL